MSPRVAVTGRLLDLEYAISVEDPELADHLPILFGDSIGSVDSPVHFLLNGLPGGRFELLRDGESLTSTDSGSLALSSLVWHMNRSVVTASVDRMLFHASVVDLDGVGVAFLGRSGDGKTTSALALARRHGGRLVSDDLIAISATGEVTGSAKPLGLRDGSFAVLGLDRAELPQPPEPYRGSTLYVSGSGAGAPVSERTSILDLVRITTECENHSPRLMRSSIGFAALLGAAFDERRLAVDEVKALADWATRCRFWDWLPSPVETLDPLLSTEDADHVP